MLSQLRDIGDRYLRRTLREVDQLQELVRMGLAGEAEALKQTEQLAHKIHGSGAMFGFDDVSECAGRIERLVAEHAANMAPVANELSTLLTRLMQAVQSAAKERGVEGSE
jgi:chemotaxis protein histidine kinase CheA